MARLTSFLVFTLAGFRLQQPVVRVDLDLVLANDTSRSIDILVG